MPRTYFTPHTTKSAAEPITGTACPTTPSNIYEACEYIIDNDDTAAIWFIKNNQITADTPDILTDNLREMLGYISTLYPAGTIAIKTRHPNDMPTYNDAIWLNATHIYTLNANHTYDIIAPQNNLYWRNKTAYKSYASYTTPRNTTPVQQPTTPRNNINIHNKNPQVDDCVKNIREYIDEHVSKHINATNSILLPNGTVSSLVDFPIKSQNTEQLYPFMETEMHKDIQTLSECIYAVDETIINYDTGKYKIFDTPTTLIRAIMQKYRATFTTPISIVNIISNITKYLACVVLSGSPGYIQPKDILDIITTQLYYDIYETDIEQLTSLFIETTGKTGKDPEYIDFIYTMLEGGIIYPTLEDINIMLRTQPLNIITPDNYPRIQRAIKNEEKQNFINTFTALSPQYPWVDIIK